MRVHDSKQDCLIIDFGGNLKRHGPIDAIDFGKPKGGGGSGNVPEKMCPGCQVTVAVGTRECECGFKFPEPKVNHDIKADAESQVLSEPEVFSVEEMRVSRHKGKGGKPDTLRVDYICRRDGGNIDEVISEWVCLEHDGFAGSRARRWWEQRCKLPMADIDQAINIWSQGGLADCRRIKARKEGKWWRIINYDLGEILEELVISDLEDEEIPF